MTVLHALAAGSSFGLLLLLCLTSVHGLDAAQANVAAPSSTSTTYFLECVGGTSIKRSHPKLTRQAEPQSGPDSRQSGVRVPSCRNYPANSLVIGNGLVEASFSSENGGLLEVRSVSQLVEPLEGALAGGVGRAGDSVVVAGPTNGGCLWGSWNNDPALQSYIGGCSFSSGDGTFSYAWSDPDSQLSFRFLRPTPQRTAEGSDPHPNRLEGANSTGGFQVDVNVSLPAGTSATTSLPVSLDFSLSMVHHEPWTVQNVAFLSDVVFSGDDVSGAMVPKIPGVYLTQRWFQEAHLLYTAPYPGSMFSDFLFQEVNGSSLSSYALGPSSTGGVPLHVSPCLLGFVPLEGRQFAQVRQYLVSVPPGTVWESPTVRLSVGLPLQAAVAAYAAAAPIMTTARPLASKAHPSVYSTLKSSPLFKSSTIELGMTFPEYSSKFLSQLPTPAIIHPCGYEFPGVFDQGYPDMLPPFAKFGSESQMAEMFDAARSFGFLVMPYTNPTWWDPKSRTLTHLPVGTSLKDVVALNSSGLPVVESYGPNSGYVVSVTNPFVQQRLSTLAHNFTAGGRVVSDCLFQDQIGARSYVRDFSPSIMRKYGTPLGYSQSWVDRTATTSSLAPLMTERGFDALFAHESGFHGSVALDQADGFTKKWWTNDDWWEPYPFGPLLGRQFVLFYQHDLAPSTMTVSPAMLAWNLAMGYQLSMDLSSWPFPATAAPGKPSLQWLNITHAFQSQVLFAYADEPMVAYNRSVRISGSPQSRVSMTQFSRSVSVYAAWQDSEPAAPFATPQGHEIPVPGVQVTFPGTTAGLFTKYNGKALSDGEHYLIEQRPVAKGGSVRIFQPCCEDSDITVVVGQDLGQQVAILACTGIGESPLTTALSPVLNGTVTFRWTAFPGGLQLTRALYYALVPAGASQCP